MQEMSAETKQKIVSTLQEKGAVLPCPRCGNKQYALLDGYFNQVIQPELKGIMLGGPAVPSVVVVCSNCGYMSQHALGSLGLMPKEEGQNNAK